MDVWIVFEDDELCEYAAPRIKAIFSTEDKARKCVAELEELPSSCMIYYYLKGTVQ